ncbi:MAG: PIN domain-containing protein [Propionibacteriaceae bacterium]|jgi:predicted nucleic acid-binding protein|nr:PIN domain-containing protein [Propionibacteriaceae bacterium]
MACKAVLDTNVLIDFLDAGRPGHRAAVELLGRLVGGGAEVGVPASSLTDVYYVLRRTAGEPAARRAIGVLVKAVGVLAVDAAVCRAALAGGEPDFEDGVVRACAEAAGAHWLVTRDRAAFARSTVPAVSPDELLARLAGPKPPAPGSAAPG